MLGVFPLGAFLALIIVPIVVIVVMVTVLLCFQCQQNKRDCFLQFHSTDEKYPSGLWSLRIPSVCARMWNSYKLSSSAFLLSNFNDVAGLCVIVGNHFVSE